MASSAQTTFSSDDGSPADLLPSLHHAGVLSDRQIGEIQAKVRASEYPSSPRELAQKLVKDRLLTEFQAKRLLKGRGRELIIGRYALVDRLGSGSMGQVFKAQHLLMGRLVALKKINPEIVTNERVVQRFYREMRLMGKLDHPNVVRAFDADQHGSLLYIVMEYVQGKSLSDLLKLYGPLKPVDVVDYAAQACLGLAHAHAQGIVHRDIKPSNLLLNEERQIKMLDLGLGVLMEADETSSFATADGIAVGTIDFMSPEQACGKEVDGRSDLYSLGCTMYNMMTGRLPFPGDSPIERLGKRITGRPLAIAELRPDLPSSVVTVLEKLMAGKPQERYQTASEAAEALQSLIRRRGGKSTGSDDAPSPPAASAVRPAPPPPAPEPVAPASSETVPALPAYPFWFRPLALMVEQSALGGLLAILSLLFVVFVAGFIVSVSLRPSAG